MAHPRILDGILVSLIILVEMSIVQNFIGGVGMMHLVLSSQLLCARRTPSLLAPRLCSVNGQD